MPKQNGLRKPRSFQGIIDATKKKIDSIANTFTINVTKNLKAGNNTNRAIAKARVDTKIKEQLTIVFSSAAAESFGKKVGGVKNEIAFRRWWLNKTFYGEKMNLSGRINDLTRFKEIESVIRSGLKEAKSWTGIATKLQLKNLQVGDISSTISNLEKSGRRLMRGDITAYNQYRKDLRKAKIRISSLIESGAPNQRLVKAYQSVINATKTTSEAALSKALKRSIKAKIQSNAERISRTEISKAYVQGVYVEAKTDTDVIGIRYYLSSAHKIYDICDYHTGVDLFNMGAGGYPMGKQPPYPFHPNCGCQTEMIYKGEEKPKRMDKKKSVNWLKKQSASDKRQLLGVKGAEKFNKNEKTWSKNLKNYEGHKSISVLQKRTKGV